MNLINYLSSLAVDGINAFFVNKEMVGDLHVYVLAIGDDYVISPFNEYGIPYTAQEIIDHSLPGVESEYPVENVPVEAKDTVYVAKQSDTFMAVSHLGGLRESFEILQQEPQGVVKLELNTEDGVITGIQSATLLDVDEIFRNPYYE